MRIGKERRLRRIFGEDRRTVIVPMDHGVTVGPIAGIVDMQKTINRLLEGNVDAVLMHKGIAKNVDTGRAALIVHVSASTKLAENPNLKVRVCEVEEALALGADAVSLHVNVGSEGEERMLAELGDLARDCDRLGVPLLAMMYPRGPKIQSEHEEAVVSHVARIGAELGADIIKTNYTGDIESFRRVIEGCPVPVVVAGGPKMSNARDVLELAYASIQAGAAGLSIGRNVFQHSNPARMVRALRAIVHENASVENAARILED
jgi:class I fructose-bisphosphate aldolase